MELIRADLNNYSLDDLEILAKYYNVDFTNILAKKLAPKILNEHRQSHKRVHMLPSEKGEIPYGGDIGQARAASDRKAIREITAWKQAQVAEPAVEESVTIEEAIDCSNDADFITGEKWTEKPDIKLHFIDPKDLSKKPYTVCLGKASLEKWMQDQNFYLLTKEFKSLPFTYTSLQNTKLNDYSKFLKDISALF